MQSAAAEEARSTCSSTKPSLSFKERQASDFEAGLNRQLFPGVGFSQHPNRVLVEFHRAI
jgi:hypothetical protein